MIRAAALALALAACGSSGPAGGAGGAPATDPALAFTGAWAAIGSRSATCSDGTTEAQDESGTVTVTRGPASDLARASTLGTICQIPLTIAAGGRAANLAAATSCTGTTTAGAPFTISISSWALTLGLAGAAAETGTGVLAVTGQGTCQTTWTDSLSR